MKTRTQSEEENRAAVTKRIAKNIREPNLCRCGCPQSYHSEIGNGICWGHGCYCRKFVPLIPKD